MEHSIIFPIKYESHYFYRKYFPLQLLVNRNLKLSELHWDSSRESEISEVGLTKTKIFSLTSLIPWELEQLAHKNLDEGDQQTKYFRAAR